MKSLKTATCTWFVLICVQCPVRRGWGYTILIKRRGTGELLKDGSWGNRKKEKYCTQCLYLLSQLNLHMQNQVAAKQQALRAADAEKLEEQKRLMASRAYQQWLANKKQQQQQRQKERKLEQELQALYKEQRDAEQKKAQDSFLSWKRHKDLERAMQCQNTADIDSEGAKQTPVLPGYCSVWSCDEELADHMLANVYRPSPNTLHYEWMKYDYCLTTRIDGIKISTIPVNRRVEIPVNIVTERWFPRHGQMKLFVIIEIYWFLSVSW